MDDSTTVVGDGWKPHNHVMDEQELTPKFDTTLKSENEEVLFTRVENNPNNSPTSLNEEESSIESFDGALNFNLENSDLQSNEASNSVESLQSTTTHLEVEEQTQVQNINSFIGGNTDLEESVNSPKYEEEATQKFCVDHSHFNSGTPHTHKSMDTNQIKELPPHLVIVSREEWRAIPPKRTIPKSHPTHIVVFTYATNSKECFTPHKCERVVRKLQRHHIRGGLPDIPYNFMVGGDGRVYEGRGWFSNPRTLIQLPEVRGCLIEIAFIGNYKVERPSEDMFDAALELIEFGRQNNWIQEEFGLYENYEGPEIKPVVIDEE